MTGFPKGLQCLVVDDSGPQGHATSSLRSLELGYSVTTITSLEEAQESFAGGAAAFDCVLCEYSLLSSAPPGGAAAFFRAAGALHVPVVLMAEAPSQAAVLQGVHWGAADFLEKPLSMLKLRTLWQHKIRKMMERGNGGVLPRRPSCPSLPPAATPSGDSTLAASTAGSIATGARCSSLPSLACPPTPSPHAGSVAAPQPTAATAAATSSLTSGVAALAAGTADSSDATSGVQRGLAAHETAAPLACMGLGAPGGALPAAVVHWPALPAGTTWGTPLGCGVPPPLLPAAAGASPAPPPSPIPQPSIKWCPPGSLPLPATTCDLLLPENFSLAHAVAEASGAACAGTAAACGPLGLRLTVTPDLLSSVNAALAAPHASPPSPAAVTMCTAQCTVQVPTTK